MMQGTSTSADEGGSAKTRAARRAPSGKRGLTGMTRRSPRPPVPGIEPGATPEERYRARKAAGICTQCGRERAIEGRYRCAPCGQKARDWDAAWQKRRRAELRKQGLCAAGCGRPSSTERCIICSINAREPLPVSLAPERKEAASVRIASATVVDKDGRNRYLGQQKKGAPSKEVISRQDAKDLRDAAREMLKSADAIEASGGADWQRMPPIQRAAYKREILSYADFGIRLAESVLDRHKYGTEATERLERGHAMRRHGK